VTVESLLGILLGVVGALAMILWGNLTYEIRKLRRETHHTASQVTALNLVVGLLCRAANIEWSNRHHEERED
jgi:hypothetical protein